MVYDSFVDFMETVVLPMKQANPTDIRLDGRVSGGSWDHVGSFLRGSRVWTVYADSRYQPLLTAYEAIRKGEADDPFVESPMQSGDRLDLTDNLQKATGLRHRYLYIYAKTRT